MRTDSLRKLLQEVRNGQLGIENALTKLKALPYENLGFARIDHHRDLRKGFPEVIYGEGKDPEHILSIVDALVKAGITTTLALSLVYQAQPLKLPHCFASGIDCNNGICYCCGPGPGDPGKFCLVFEQAFCYYVKHNVQELIRIFN